jgi:hypothetical protein
MSMHQLRNSVHHCMTAFSQPLSKLVPKQCLLTYNIVTILWHVCTKTIRTLQDTVEGEGI